MKHLIAAVALLVASSALAQMQPVPVFQQKGKEITVFDAVIVSGTYSSIYDFSGFASASITYQTDDAPTKSCSDSDSVLVDALGASTTSGPWTTLDSMQVRTYGKEYLELDALVRTKYLRFFVTLSTNCSITVKTIPYAFASTVTIEGRVAAGNRIPETAVRPVITSGLLRDTPHSLVAVQVPDIVDVGNSDHNTDPAYGLAVKDADTMRLKFYAQEVLVLASDYTDVAPDCYGNPKYINSIIIQNNGTEEIACAISYGTPSGYANGVKVPGNGGTLSAMIKTKETFVQCIAKTTDQVTGTATNVIYGCQDFNPYSP